MRTKKSMDEIEEIEQMDEEQEETEEENENIDDLSKEKKENDKETEEEKKITGDINFYIKSSIVYTEDEFRKLFGKPSFNFGKTSVGLLRDETGESKVIVHDYDFGDDTELLRRTMEVRGKLPLIPLLVLVGGILLLLFWFFSRGGNEAPTTPQVIEKEVIPQEYLDAYNEKQAGGFITNTSGNIDSENIAKIIELNDKLKMCESEINRVNIVSQNNTTPTCPACEESKKQEYESCIIREKNNEWLVYQGQILEKMCKTNIASKEKCAEIYYNYFLTIK